MTRHTFNIILIMLNPLRHKAVITISTQAQINNHHFHSQAQIFRSYIQWQLMLNVEYTTILYLHHSTLFTVNIDFENLFTSGLEMVVNL